MAPRTSEPFEEAPQVRGFRIPREASQVMKHAVGTQRLGGFDSPQAQNLRVGQSIQRFADTVAVVSLSESDVPPERALQVDALEELLDQSHSAELGQANPIGSNAKIARSTRHCCQTAFLMRVHNKAKIGLIEASSKHFWNTTDAHDARFRLTLVSGTLEVAQHDYRFQFPAQSIFPSGVSLHVQDDELRIRD